MTSEPSRRPAHLKPPAHLSQNPPVPAPSPEPPAQDEILSPTRYGDWERNGIAVDF
jgi:hypothetical protein